MSALWLVAILGLMAWGAAVWGLDRAENDLTVRAEAALARADFEVGVTFRGRDAALSGEVASAERRDAAASLVAGLVGVRVVDTGRLTVSTAAPPEAPAAPALSDVAVIVEVNAGRALLSGRLRDPRDAAALRAAAAAAFGPTAVADEIEVAPDVAAAPWLGDVARAVALLGPMTEGRVEVDAAGSVVLRGVVPTEADAEAISAAFALPGWSVDDGLLVGRPLAPSVHVFRKDPGGEVTVGGILYDEDIVAAFMTQAVTAYGPNAVVDETVLGLVADPAYLVDIAALVPATVGLETWEIALDDAVLTVTGYAADVEALAGARTAFAELDVPGVALVPQLELTAGAVADLLTDLFAGVEVFVPGGTDLSEEAQALVEDAVAIMNDHPSARLTVEGHTDSTGDPGANQIISQARAEAIVVYLVAGGVEAGRLSAVGLGDTRPVGNNATEEGRSMNRRIEFVPREDG